MQSSEKFVVKLKNQTFSVCTQDNVKETKKYVIKLKKEQPLIRVTQPLIRVIGQKKRKPNFKDFIYNQIISKVSLEDPYLESEAPSGCTVWLGYKKKHRHYSEACHIVRLKNGVKHYINPQKYIYNYLNYSDAQYTELINMKNRVRNIDNCQNRGLCCSLAHIEAY